MQNKNWYNATCIIETHLTVVVSFWSSMRIPSNAAFPLIAGGKVCYAEPQDLTDIVREAIKERKNLPPKSEDVEKKERSSN